jgi:hypothetical protein
MELLLPGESTAVRMLKCNDGGMVILMGFLTDFFDNT